MAAARQVPPLRLFGAIRALTGASEPVVAPREEMRRITSRGLIRRPLREHAFHAGQWEN
ncbi:MAG TPA: hypothetical protein VIS99_12855 [Terrimicrobiaceae bacterium]